MSFCAIDRPVQRRIHTSSCYLRGSQREDNWISTWSARDEAGHLELEDRSNGTSLIWYKGYMQAEWSYDVPQRVTDVVDVDIYHLPGRRFFAVPMPGLTRGEETPPLVGVAVQNVAQKLPLLSLATTMPPLRTDPDPAMRPVPTAPYERKHTRFSRSIRPSRDQVVDTLDAEDLRLATQEARDTRIISDLEFLSFEELWGGGAPTSSSLRRYRYMSKSWRK